MLIYLDPSLIDYFRSGSPSLMDYEVLDRIISSHRKRYHYVISTREGLESLITLDKLSDLCKRQLKMMSHDYSTVSRIVKQVATKIIVKDPQSEFKRIENSVNSHFISSKKRRIFSNFSRLNTILSWIYMLNFLHIMRGEFFYGHFS